MGGSEREILRNFETEGRIRRNTVILRVILGGGHWNDRNNPDSLRHRQPRQLRRKISSIRLGWLPQSMHDGCAALHRPVDRRSPPVDRNEMDLRLSRPRETKDLI